MGRAGRAAIVDRLPTLRRDWGLDFVVVNGENASQGAGLTAEHARVLLGAGADCLTLGDHAFDQKDMLQYIEAGTPDHPALELLQGRPRSRCEDF